MLYYVWVCVFPFYITRLSSAVGSSTTAEITRVKRPFKVTEGHPLLWLSIISNSNLTSIFNRSWDITPSFAHSYPPLFHVELAEPALGKGESGPCPGPAQEWASRFRAAY